MWTTRTTTDRIVKISRHWIRASAVESLTDHASGTHISLANGQRISIARHHPDNLTTDDIARKLWVDSEEQP